MNIATLKAPSRPAPLQGWRWLLLLLALAPFLGGCTTVQKQEIKQRETVKQRVEKLRDSSAKINGEIFFLEFDVNGRLTTPTELLRAVEQIKASLTTADPLTNLAILSYGWSYNRSKDEETYAGFIRDYVESMYGTNGTPGRWAAICVSWESDHGGFATLAKEWVPGNFIAEKIARPLDYVAFPLSVWSKAALADRIGYGELKDAINYLYAETYQKEEVRSRIFVAGHSFGTRVLSGLLKNNTGEFWTRTLKAVGRKLDETVREQIIHQGPPRAPEPEEDPFVTHVNTMLSPFIKDVRGALFIQPALTEFDLPAEQDGANYPIVVTQTRHDHLNGFLFPISSVPFNASLSSGYEQVSLYLAQTNDFRTKALRELHDFFRVPYTITVSSVVFPFSYVWAQVREIRDRGPLHILDTLAQLPVAEALVYYTTGIDGDRKGLFTFGPLHESAGRVSTLGAGSLTNFAMTDRPLVFTNSATFLQADEEIRNGVLGRENLENEFVDFTIGWLDPLGAHSTYDYARNEADRKLTYDVLQKVFQEQVTGTNNVEQPKGHQRYFWELINRRKNPPPAQVEQMQSK